MEVRVESVPKQRPAPKQAPLFCEHLCLVQVLDYSATYILTIDAAYGTASVEIPFCLSYHSTACRRAASTMIQQSTVPLRILRGAVCPEDAPAARPAVEGFGG